jgi:uncharacterized protein (TIGR01777 family)
VKVAITGASGLIGSALGAALRADGHAVVRLVRRPPRAPDEVRWDPASGVLDAADLAGVDAGVNLAGVGFGDRRWSDRYRALIRSSRLDSTSLFSAALADAGGEVLVSASAMGYYGDRGDDLLTEDSPPGDDFPARVCVEWEAATAPAAERGVRVAHIRSGLVFAAEAPLLKKVALPFKLGLGGRIGSGKQFWSWIDIADEVAAIRFLLERPELEGPFNLNAPDAVRFDEIRRALGRVLRRPTVMPVPSFAIRLLFGAERANSIVLAGQRMVPQRLTEAGFRFAHTDVEDSLRRHLGGS